MGVYEAEGVNGWGVWIRRVRWWAGDLKIRDIYIMGGYHGTDKTMADHTILVVS